MPRFDFTCQKCGHTFESTIPFGIKTSSLCPLCEGPTEKCIAPPSIHFKGQGFYKTDSSQPLKTPTKEPPAEPKIEKKENKPEQKQKGGDDAKK